MKPFTAKSTKICEICGKEFIPKSRAQKICEDVHTRPCPVCGSPVVIRYKSDREKCCSRRCTGLLKKRAYLDRFGVDNPAKSDEIKKKISETNLFRYGVTTPFLADDFQEKRRNTSLGVYGTEHPMQSSIVKEHHKQSCLDNWGVDEPFKLDHVRDAMMDIYCDDDRLKDISSKRLLTCRCEASDGTKFDSRYEVVVYEYCLRNNIKVERQVPISYYYKGNMHTTYIDFEIDGIKFECKGGHLLEGCYDGSPNLIPIDVKINVYKRNDVVVITDDLGKKVFGKPNSTESNGLRYKNKCPEPLIGVDIDLFRNPEFPYRGDRPKCFYDVKVDGQMSAHDAFFDEKIRWNMIMNRIQYSGGFIDADQVLNALNITRTCKQPSWFSKSFAKTIISEYCTSDTIVDPFAGWGARADAANDLHRVYIGGDFNPELVEWHHSKGRTNINLQDANTFTYDGECSVFICPPYSDPTTGRCFEDYNFEGFDAVAKQKSQCDWLNVIIHNIPNAKEYVMVCKVVDSGWERFIVNTKQNKSHFGVNNEYVLCIKHDQLSYIISES